MSTWKQKFNKKYRFPRDEPHSKSEITKLTGVSKSILDKVYDRGVGAWETNPGSVRNIKGVKGGPGKKMSAEAWAMGRIYSFVMGGKTQKTADKDLWEKHMKKKNKTK